MKSASLLAGVLLIFCLSAVAQTYPVRPIRLIVNFAPGGTGDIVTRAIGGKLSEQLKQPVIVDNRGGAGGIVGAQIVAQSPSDGYTLLLGSNGALTIAPNLGKMPYDPVRDFAPVSLVALSQFVLVTHPSVKAESVKQLITIAKDKPGSLFYGSAGTGSVAHLAGELFKHLASVDIVHVPYKGSGPMTIDLIGGQVQMSFPGLSSLVPHIKSGAVKALAVTGRSRSSIVPELPTVSESGLAGYEATTFWGILAPSKLSPEIVKRLAEETQRAVQNPNFKKQLVSLGFDPVGSNPVEFAEQIQIDTQKWRKIVNVAGIRVE